MGGRQLVQGTLEMQVLKTLALESTHAGPKPLKQERRQIAAIERILEA